MNYRYGMSLMVLFFVNSAHAALRELSAGASSFRPTDIDTDDESVGGDGGDFVLLKQHSSTQNKLDSSDEKSTIVGSGTTLVKKPVYLDDQTPTNEDETVPSQAPTLLRSFLGGILPGALWAWPVVVGLESWSQNFSLQRDKEIAQRLYGIGGTTLAALTVCNARQSGEPADSNLSVERIDWEKLKHALADYAGTTAGTLAVFAGIVWARDLPFKTLIKGIPWYGAGAIAAKAMVELSNACKPSTPPSSHSKKYLK